MRKIYLIPILIIAAGVIAFAAYTLPLNKQNNITPNPVACTMEAKLCPDGSAVGRVGPNCDFAACPVPPAPVSGKSGITGAVTLGPTCPVERIPPVPACAPKGFQTSIDITKSGSTQIIKSTKSDGNGEFSIDLDPGTYVLRASNDNILPRCADVTVTVKSGQYTSADISCDTGIR